MLDKDFIADQLGAIKAELARNQQERAALLKLQCGFQELLQVSSDGHDVRQMAMPISHEDTKSKSKGTMSFRAGLVHVLKEVPGEALDVDEIWERMQNLGVRSDAKRPTGFIGLTKKRVPEIEKVSPRLFRWIGPNPE